MHSAADELLLYIDTLQKKKGHIIVALDGRCAAGKTTLALRLSERRDCNVLHMDHFFLRPEQRVPERLAIPGENVDHERFLTEVLLPLKSGVEFSYRPFDCRRQDFSEPVYIPSKAVNIVEGSYSCHPSLWQYYDLRVFLSTDPNEQLRRIRERNGKEQAKQFAQKWIPLEEKYFSAYGIAQKCDLHYST